MQKHLYENHFFNKKILIQRKSHFIFFYELFLKRIINFTSRVIIAIHLCGWKGKNFPAIKTCARNKKRKLICSLMTIIVIIITIIIWEKIKNDLFSLSRIYIKNLHIQSWVCIYKNHNNKLSLTAPTIICRLYMSNKDEWLSVREAKKNSGWEFYLKIF